MLKLTLKRFKFLYLFTTRIIKMKNHLLFSIATLVSVVSASAQTYAPIATTGYTLDAVAENTTALSTTGGVLDGSNYVMYSQAYGALYGGAYTGLPNNGLISNGTRTYQLQSYTTTNVLYVPGLQSDTLTFTTPAPYQGISVLGFATEGSATMDVKVRFSDGTTQLFSGVSLSDWFSGTNTVVVGFDRCNRSTGTPAYVGAAGNPRMYYVDLPLTCANSQKNISRIVFQNTSGNARLCIMAASGALAPVITATSSPVTCQGGTNGSATVTVANGLPPFTYTWPGQQAQNSNIGNVLPPGIVVYTVTNVSGCQFTAAVNVSQNIVPTAPITITASALQVCSGYSVELTTSGASTYTWSNNGATNSTTVNPVSTGLFSVVATTSDNCTVTGSITITTLALPVPSFTFPPKLCLNAAAVALAASPAGGTFDGTAIIFNSFYPNQAGAGSFTLSYSYTDQNGCLGVTTVTTTVASPTTVIGFSITPATVCSTAPALTLNATPAGGTYTGQGVSATGVFNPATAGLGTRTVSYTYTDDNNCTATKVASVQVTFCNSTGIAEIGAQRDLVIYPNPAHDLVHLLSPIDTRIRLVNAVGQVVAETALQSGVPQLMSLDQLPDGLYILMCSESGRQSKLIITR